MKNISKMRDHDKAELAIVRRANAKRRHKDLRSARNIKIEADSLGMSRCELLSSIVRR